MPKYPPGVRGWKTPGAAVAAMLNIAGLNVWFGDPPERVDAVKSASLGVAQGESFGLVGESGSGKSTILRAVTGLIGTWSGLIEVAGEKVQGKHRSRAFHKTVQMVFQDPYASLHPRHTIDRTLSEPLAIHGIGGADQKVPAALEAVGLPAAFRFR